ARMRDPEALQIGPGAVARLRRGGRSPEPDFNKDPYFIFKSRLRSLLPALAGNSLRVLTIVKGLRRADAVPSPNEGPGSAADRAGRGGAIPPRRTQSGARF